MKKNNANRVSQKIITLTGLVKKNNANRVIVIKGMTVIGLSLQKQYQKSYCHKKGNANRVTGI